MRASLYEIQPRPIRILGVQIWLRARGAAPQKAPAVRESRPDDHPVVQEEAASTHVAGEQSLVRYALNQ